MPAISFIPILGTSPFRILVVLAAVMVMSCGVPKYHQVALTSSAEARKGSDFYKISAAMNWRQRDSLAVDWVSRGHVPDFFTRFRRISTSIVDSATGKTISAQYYVSPDYLCVGSNNDWARVCITPMAAQRIGGLMHASLPTRKMVDDIYRQATVKPEPVPMYAFRDSTPTMWHHHLIIEGQRQGRKGLIAGIKKDLVNSTKIYQEKKHNKVAIYGWHKPDGKPIQPLYTGHVNWYVDYSHGVRLVWDTMYVNGKKMSMTEVFNNHALKRLICDEPQCEIIDFITIQQNVEKGADEPGRQ